MFSIKAREIALRTIDTEISRREEIIGYVFTDKLLSAEPLQMRGPSTHLYIGRTEYVVAHNGRPEQIGDRILEAVLAKAWYEARDEDGTANKEGPVEHHFDTNRQTTHSC